MAQNSLQEFERNKLLTDNVIYKLIHLHIRLNLIIYTYNDTLIYIQYQAVFLKFIVHPKIIKYFVSTRNFWDKNVPRSNKKIEISV